MRRSSTHDRFEPLPGFTKLPGWLWAKLSRRGRAVVLVAGLAVGVVLAVAVIDLVRTGDRQAVEQARRDGAAAAERRRALSARADLGRGVLTWCKRNPRPPHPDTAAFVVVPVSKSCLP